MRDCAAACSARIVTSALVSTFSKISCGRVLLGDDLCLLGMRSLLQHVPCVERRMLPTLVSEVCDAYFSTELFDCSVLTTASHRELEGGAMCAC